MMKGFYCTTGILAALGCVCACSPNGQAEPEAVISTDKAAIVVEADAVPCVTDTIRITSSRSWSASVRTGDGGGWISVSSREHINAGEILETSDLALKFSRHKGTGERTATLRIYCAETGAPLEIPVVQKAYSPKLSLEAVGNPSGIPSSGGEFQVIVRSNTRWKASVLKEESTVIPTISPVEGEDTQTISLEFPANTDDEMARFASLLVSTEGCEPCRMEFVQSQSGRFFLLDSPVAEEVLPYESSVHIPLKSNGPWKASVSECTFENGRVEPSEGLLSYSGFDFNYDLHGEDPLVGNKHALITISRDGMQDIVVEFTQKGSIHLNFGHFNPDCEWKDTGWSEEEFSYKPYTVVTKVFSEPSSFPYNYSTGTYGGIPTDCTTSAGGFVFKMYGSDCGLYYAPGSYCFCIGKKKGDYVAFPSFEGYRLSELYYESSCRNITPYTIRDSKGNVIEGGEPATTVRTVPIYKEYNDMHHHVFPGTKPGEDYRMVLEKNLSVISIKDLCLVYEKYE